MNAEVTGDTKAGTPKRSRNVKSTGKPDTASRKKSKTVKSGKATEGGTASKADAATANSTAAPRRGAGTLIRLARNEADIEAMIELGRRLHAESRFRDLPYEPNRLREMGRLGLQKGNPALIMAERDGRAIGVAVATLGEHYFSPALAVTVQLIYVIPEVRGGFAAVKMLRALRRWAAQAGAGDLHVNVTTAISTARTDRFLRRMGFRQTGGNYVLEGLA